MYDKEFVLAFADWFHYWLSNWERRDTSIEFEKFKRIYNK